jgi:hypothetical protein
VFGKRRAGCFMGVSIEVDDERLLCAGGEQPQHRFVTVGKDTLQLAPHPHVGLVRGVGFRNGTGPSTAGPYRRTLLYVMDDYLRSFQQSVGNSLATDGVNAKPNDVGAKGTNSKLAEELELLDALRDKGSLTVEGYEELKQRAIDSYRTP